MASSGAWTTPVVRWVGSKRALTARLLASCPREFANYWEPFAGSAVLFFARKPASGILSDRNADLMNAYVHLRRSPKRVWRALSEIGGDRDTYLAVRALPHPPNSIDAAVRFFYLNRYCFNGIYRTNRRGEFNVPFGSRQGGIPPLAHFERAAEALKAAQLLTADFADALETTEAGDFVYMDPPFTRRTATHGEFGYGSFGPSDEERLLATIRSLHERGVLLLVSYHETELLRRGLPEFEFSTIQVYHQVGGAASRRSESSEVLISNYPISRAAGAR